MVDTQGKLVSIHSQSSPPFIFAGPLGCPPCTLLASAASAVAASFRGDQHAVCPCRGEAREQRVVLLWLPSPRLKPFLPQPPAPSLPPIHLLSLEASQRLFIVFYFIFFFVVNSSNLSFPLASVVSLGLISGRSQWLT